MPNPVCCRKNMFFGDKIITIAAATLKLVVHVLYGSCDILAKFQLFTCAYAHKN